MHGTIVTQSIRIFPNRDLAIKDRDILAEIEEDGWSYRVKPHGTPGTWVVAMYDEDNEFVAYL